MRFFYFILSGLSLLSLNAHAKFFYPDYVCDNSRIIMTNLTNESFNIDSVTPASGSQCMLENEGAENTNTLPPQSTLTYKVHSGRMTWGESLGTIQLSHKNNQYELFYLLLLVW